MKKFLIPFLAGIAVILLIAAQPKIGTRAVMLEVDGVGTNTLFSATSTPSGRGLQVTNASIESIHRRTAGATSHSYEPIRLHYGDPATNAYWSWILASFTNTFDASGTFDYTMSYGFNSPSSPNYVTNLPTVAFGIENEYVTSGSVRQSEWYMNFGVNSTNFHARPMGMSLIHSYPSRVTFDYNVDQMSWNALDGLPTVQIISDANQSNLVYLKISRAGYLDFTDNTNTSAGLTGLIQKSGVRLFGLDTNGFTALSGAQIGATNTLALFPNFDPAAYSQWLTFGIGTWTSRRGFRWNHLTSLMEVSHDGVGWSALASTNLTLQTLNVTQTQTNTSSATTVPLVIRGPAGHVAPAFLVLTNSGVTNFAVMSNGVVALRPTTFAAAQIQVPGGSGNAGDGISVLGSTTDFVQSGLARIRMGNGAIETTDFIGLGTSGSVGNPTVSIFRRGDAQLVVGTGLNSGFGSLSASNVAMMGRLHVTNAIASYLSNGVASAAITFPATTATWTNTFGYNIVLYVDNTGVTATAVAKNGQQIFGVPAVNTTLLLKPNDFFSQTYSAGTPTARWEPQ